VGRRGVTIKLRDGSGTRTFKYLSEEKDRRGNMRMYFRRAGKRIRLKQEIGTDEFLEEYNAALRGLPRAVAEPRITPASRSSLAWLAQQYYESGEFKRLDEGTQTVRRGIVDRICEQHGTKPFAQMEERHVRKIRDEKAAFPNAANSRVKTLRQIFKWAVEAQLARINPAKGVPYLNVGTDGYHTWTIEEVRQFEAHYPIGTRERLGMAILFFLGVRRSDAVRLGIPMEIADGTKIRFTEVKGRNRKIKLRELMILPQLRNVLDNSQLGKETYLATRSGKPFSSDGFGNWFGEACNRAGLPQCSAHGLRKAGATIAAENGASEMELAAIFGWTDPKQAAVYTRKANRVLLADRAMHLLIPERSEDKPGQKGDGIVALSDLSEAGATKTGKKARAAKDRR